MTPLVKNISDTPHRARARLEPVGVVGWRRTVEEPFKDE